MANTRGFITLTDADYWRPLYRIFSQHRFRELVADRMNSLVRPAKWEDPFENALLKAKGVLEDGARVSVGFKDDLYAQCWTTNRDSDAMWRIYSHDKSGVRVRTTVGALYEGLVTSCPDFHEISCFIGRVEYQSADGIVSRFTNSRWATAHVLDTSGRGQASTLLLKRPEFAHEQEVRLVYFANERNRTDSDVYRYTIDPFSLFDEVAFDPRWEPAQFLAAKVEAEMAGFSNVIQSDLYRLPEFTWNVGRY